MSDKLGFTVNGQTQVGYWRVDNLDELAQEEEGEATVRRLMERLTRPWAIVRDKEAADQVVDALNRYVGAR